MKRKRQGFSLIELLAVIVILGLLMAIAIPSVTKYITQSRKKTLVSTISNYISALSNQVNDMEYVFTGTNIIYAVPIECIALERGGTNPFGEWHQASNVYWAYVLVQYDDASSSYTYGFTFKDSAGYGLYPTTSEKLSENGSQIQNELGDLKKVETRYALDYLGYDKWYGFNVSSSTRIVVLESTSVGMNGDGKSSCTLCQKGNNYHQVELEKKDKWKVGKEICFEEECFNIISSDSATVTMLSKEKIEITTNNPKQNANAGDINFSTNRYWVVPGGGWNLKPEYGTEYPAYFYDENSNLYQYVEAYENKLKNMGISSVSARLISIEQINNIRPAGTWFNKDYVWFTGSFQSALNIYRCVGNGCGLQNYAHVIAGIRPIITVDKVDINFN